MKSYLTILVGDVPSTKEYTIDSETDLPFKGKVKTSYLHDSQKVMVENLADLYDVIGYVRELQNGFIIRGVSEEDVQTGVRRTLFKDEKQHVINFAETGSAWVCCDFDQYDVPDIYGRNSVQAYEYLIENHMPKQFKDVSYIYQSSASAGLEYKGHPVKPGTSVHLFFYLDQLVTNEQFKNWFAKEIDDGFDRSTFNTVLPIFVSSFVKKDIRIIDRIPEEQKYALVAKNTDVVKVPVIKPRALVPQTCKTVTDFETKESVLQEIAALGAICKRGNGFIKLWHPAESSRGDWFIYLKTPTLVSHHTKPSMNIKHWLKQFWNYELKTKIDYQPDKQPNRQLVKKQYAESIKNNNTL